MEKVLIWSATPLTETDVRKLRHIIQNSHDRDRDLRNQFSNRYQKRKGRNIYFDLGKRQHCTEIEVGQK